jgi:hypothetical protein
MKNLQYFELLIDHFEMILPDSLILLPSASRHYLIT